MQILKSHDLVIYLCSNRYNDTLLLICFFLSVYKLQIQRHLSKSIYPQTTVLAEKPFIMDSVSKRVVLVQAVIFPLFLSVIYMTPWHVIKPLMLCVYLAGIIVTLLIMYQKRRSAEHLRAFAPQLLIMVTLAGAMLVSKVFYMSTCGVAVPLLTAFIVTKKHVD